MSDAAFKVTVDEPVTIEITMSQVREYLTSKGWKSKIVRGSEVWQCGDVPPCMVCLDGRPRLFLNHIAAHERRMVVETLREIAKLPALPNVPRAS